MSRWEEEFNNHPIHETLLQMRRFLKNVSNKDIDDNHKAERSRIRSVFIALKISVENTDPNLLPHHLLTGLNDQIHNTGFYGEMSNYASSKDVDLLMSANDIFTNEIDIDSLMSATAFPLKTEKTIRTEYDRFYQVISTKENEIKNILESNKQQLSDMRDLIEKKTEDISNNQSLFDKSVDQIYTEIEEKREDVRKLHGLVITEGIAGGFKENADAEKKIADVWRRISMGIYMVIPAWIGWTTYGVDLPDAIFDWPVYSQLGPFSIAAFIVAKFASNQSNLHRTNAGRMRQFYLETEAFNPFIDSLPEPRQHILTEEFTRHIFGQNYNTEEKPKSSWFQNRPIKNPKEWVRSSDVA